MGTVFDLLEREWVTLADDTTTARRLRDVCRRAGDARTLGDVERYVRAADPVAADEVLLELARRAVGHGDDLAARVLLQLLLPGTRNLARRWWALGDPDERAAAAVAAVYHRIRRYPIERRPGRIAANVLMDAARELRRAVARAATETTVPTPEPRPADHHRSAAGSGPDAAAELADVLLDAVDAGTISRADAELIAQSRIAGTRVEAIAARRGLSTRTVWARRQAAERSLAATG
jgi:hypothetical protein